MRKEITFTGSENTPSVLKEQIGKTFTVDNESIMISEYVEPSFFEFNGDHNSIIRTKEHKFNIYDLEKDGVLTIK